MGTFVYSTGYTSVFRGILTIYTYLETSRTNLDNLLLLHTFQLSKGI